MVLALLFAMQAAAPIGTSPAVARGEKLFAQGCAVGYCHGTAGAASRGPRLRGRTFSRDYLLKITRDGIPNTAMPAWKDRLTDDDIQVLVDYVMSLATATIDPASSTAAAPEAAIVKDFDGPAEAKPGRELFFDAARQQRCSTCHRIAGAGVAVAADLARSSGLRTASLINILRANRPKAVYVLKTKDGETLTGMVSERNAQVVRIYDLMATPPVLRTFAAADIASIGRAQRWQHWDGARPYKASEIDAISKYLGWVAGK